MSCILPPRSTRLRSCFTYRHHHLPFHSPCCILMLTFPTCITHRNATPAYLPATHMHMLPLQL